MLCFGGERFLNTVTYKLRMAEVVGDFIGAPYKLGGRSRHEGFDCLSLVLAMGEKLGFDVPDSFDGFDYDSYPELWLSDESKAKRIMIRLVSELGSKIEPHLAFAPDILVLGLEEDVLVGVHVGKDLFISAFVNAGVDFDNIRKYDIVGVYRWAE